MNSTSVMLSYIGDIAFMTFNKIDYTLTIVNVVNPPSVMPINYKI